jgi:NADH-quinone oxidoreductase subunit D
VRRDLRKDEPYLCYADNWDGQGAEAVKFSVPLGSEGDVYAALPGPPRGMPSRRCEIIASSSTTSRAGPIDTFADGKMVKPRKDDVYGSIEGLIQHFELIMTNRGWEPPVAEATAQRDRQRRAGLLHRLRRRPPPLARQDPPAELHQLLSRCPS